MAYYALAAGAVAHRETTRSIRQNMPDPLPVMVLGRLAVDVRVQGNQVVRGFASRCPASLHPGIAKHGRARAARSRAE